MHMKPRELWIPDDIVERLEKVPIAPMLRPSKFREVVAAEEGIDVRRLPNGKYVRNFEHKTIDWDKIYENLKDQGVMTSHFSYFFTEIQQLVERSLRGDL